MPAAPRLYEGGEGGDGLASEAAVMATLVAVDNWWWWRGTEKVA